MDTPVLRQVVRFRDFTLDLRSFQLLRIDRRVRLERQPMDLLILLIERSPALVTHEEIADRLWGKDVFVDVETAIHGAVRKVRRALHDSKDHPVFVETVPARGYRFIAPVEVVTSSAPASNAETARAGTERDVAAAISGTSAQTPVITDGPASGLAAEGSSARWAWRLGVAAVFLLSSLLIWYWLARGGTPSRVTIAVLPFENLSGDTARNTSLKDSLRSWKPRSTRSIPDT